MTNETPFRFEFRTGHLDFDEPVTVRVTRLDGVAVVIKNIDLDSIGANGAESATSDLNMVTMDGRILHFPFAAFWEILD